jgi:3-oxoadipate enol-lactonase
MKRPAASSRSASSRSKPETRAGATTTLPLPDERRAPVALPPGRALELPAGTTFVRELPGPRGAPTVILLHGWLATADLNWFRSYEALGRHFRVLALDHRGHGRGLKTTAPFRLEDCADDVAEAAAILGIERAIAVGYSMGGPIAQLLWRRHPALVCGLVLCATTGSFSNRPSERMAFSMLAGAAIAARATPPPVRRRVHRRVNARRHDDTDVGLWARAESTRSDPRALLEAGRALGAFDSHPWIGDVDVPTAVVVTELDQLVSPGRQRKLAAAIPGSRVHPVAGDHLACAGAAADAAFVPVLLEACLGVAADLDR